MTDLELKDLLNKIEPADLKAIDACTKRQAKLAKPPGSLGKLEDISIKLAGITGEVKNQIKKTGIIVFAADNGVVEEGVSCTPVAVTKSQSINMTMYKTGMSTIAKHFGCKVTVVDVGIASDVACKDVINKKIKYGTDNLVKGPAMTREDALRAIEIGIEQAKAAKEAGFDALGIGEMGIGNTTTSACVLACLTGKSAAEVAGRGGGLTDEAFLHKKEVIDTAIKLNSPDNNDPVDILAKVGGFDLAAMTGCFIGCALYKIPVVVDGYISVVAALLATRLNSNILDYLFLSHASFEVGYKIAADALKLEPSLLLGMRLGEGSGCPIMFEILKAACAIICDMATFEEAEIKDDYLDEIRSIDAFNIN